MPAFVISHTRKIHEEAISQRVPERRESHDRVPGKVDRIELDVRQHVEHVRVERHPHLLVRGDLLLCHHDGLVRPGGVVRGFGHADGEPGDQPGEGGVREPRLGEGVGSGQHERAHLGQRRAGAGFLRAGLVGGVRGGAGPVRAPRAEVAGRGTAPGVEPWPWERRGGGGGGSRGGEETARRGATREWERERRQPPEREHISPEWQTREVGRFMAEVQFCISLCFRYEKRNQRNRGRRK